MAVEEEVQEVEMEMEDSKILHLYNLLWALFRKEPVEVILITLNNITV